MSDHFNVYLMHVWNMIEMVCHRWSDYFEQITFITLEEHLEVFIIRYKVDGRNAFNAICNI